MSLMIFEKCWRNRSDCMSLSAIDAPPHDITEEQYVTGDYRPETFVCMGVVKSENRNIPQDAYRICFACKGWKEDGEGIHESDNDEQDLTHLMHVISHGLAVLATRRVNSGKVDVLTEDGIETVETMQGGREPRHETAQAG